DAAPSESGPSSATASEPSGVPSTPVADPEHAVDPPGEVQTPLENADVLIVDPDEPISDELAARITKLEGVTEVTRLGIVQASIENKIYNVAVVDPASYRRFTESRSALLQDQWDRVAGGELAVAEGLKGRLPIDDDGYLKLGSGEGDAVVHVGAYAPQIPTVDLVVNAAWGKELGMTEPNAVLISARDSTPQALSNPIERLAGGLVPQNLDIASQLGLDPDAVQVAVPVGTFADAVGTFRYSVLSGGRIAPDPGWVKSHITTEVVPILGSVTCNRAIFPQLKAALAEIVSRGLADEIHADEYAGCYYPRFIAGSTTLSNHAFGLALDLNVPGNQRGTVGEIDRDVVAIFKSWGFGWGGDWRYTDPMHFEMNRIVNPG
ncbi:MAG TPA: M15 family metallopeptidase, partial [Nocardioides sp.]|nr:M15 family metallopeptidase [Nocardioides sp.]